MVSNYPSIYDIEASMVSMYPDIKKKWYPLIPTYVALDESFKQQQGHHAICTLDVLRLKGIICTVLFAQFF